MFFLFGLQYALFCKLQHMKFNKNTGNIIMSHIHFCFQNFLVSQLQFATPPENILALDTQASDVQSE